jgi:hypothetical protein
MSTEPETFAVVQHIRNGRRRPTKLGDRGALNGRLYCEDCGEKLHIKRRASGEKAAYVYYICHRSRSYTEGRGDCTPHSIRKEVIEQLVLADLTLTYLRGKFLHDFSSSHLAKPLLSTDS